MAPYWLRILFHQRKSWEASTYCSVLAVMFLMVNSDSPYGADMYEVLRLCELYKKK